ncbi:MAG: tyrosine-type recombinase/integrase [Chloroflexia bacterium]|nr:tyrosine-type recombinase/integrase [Chloroflexia bacterium]
MYEQAKMQWPLLSEYMGGVSPATRGVMRSRLRAVAVVLGADYEDVVWHELTAERVDRIREALLDGGTAPGTVNVGLAAIRGLARTAYDLRMIEYDQYHAIQELRNCRTEPAPTGRPATHGELSALFATCNSDRGVAGVRDTALLAAVYAGALECREAVNLDLDDYSLEPPSLRVKAGREHRRRAVLLGDQAADAIAGWIAVRGGRPGKLFSPISKGGSLVEGGMSPKAVFGILEKRSRQAGIQPLTPRDIRHTAIRDLWESGMNLPTLRRIVGQASLLTVERYCRHAGRRSAHISWHGQTPYHRW